MTETELDRARQLKRERQARSKALKGTRGRVLSFRAEELGLIGQILVDDEKLKQWDSESVPAIQSAIAAIVREALGIPAKETRRLDEFSSVPSFEPSDSFARQPRKPGCSRP